MAGNVNSRPTITTSQILQGAGKFKVNGIELGGYQNGVKVTFNQSEKFIESEQLLGPVDSEIEKVDMMVETELEEATLENLAVAMFNINSSSVLSGTSSKVLDLVPSSVMPEYTLEFEGMSGTDRTKLRTFTISKAVRIGSSSTTLQRGTKMTIPVQFKILLDSTGKFGTIKDATK